MDITCYAIMFVDITLLVYAAITDLRKRLVYNFVPISLLVFYAFVAFLFPEHYFSWLNFLGASLVLAVGMFFNAMGWLGGGDVKLLAVLALWVGWLDLAGFLVCVALAGGGLSLIWLMLRRLGQAIASPTLEAWTANLPYGVAISATGILFLLEKIKP